MNARATTEETDGGFELLEYTGREGDAAPIHIHPASSEGFYVVEGELTMLVSDEELRTTAGSFSLIPPGERHAFRIDSPTAKFLQLMAPGGIFPFFQEVGEPAPSAMLPPVSDEPWTSTRLWRRCNGIVWKLSVHPPGTE